MYIYIKYDIFLHPQSGSLFWPLSEKAPLENQRQISMGRGISLLSTIFTHQNTPNWFLLQEVPITKGGHCLLLKQKHIHNSIRCFMQKRFQRILQLLFQSGSSRMLSFQLPKKTAINCHQFSLYAIAFIWQQEIHAIILFNLPQG